MMKTPIPKEELLQSAHRQSALRDELLQRHAALVQEVSTADVRSISQRHSTLRHYAAAACLALALVLPTSLLVNSRMPDATMALAGYDRAQALHTATLILS